MKSVIIRLVLFAAIIAVLPAWAQQAPAVSAQAQDASQQARERAAVEKQAAADAQRRITEVTAELEAARAAQAGSEKVDALRMRLDALKAAQEAGAAALDSMALRGLDAAMAAQLLEQRTLEAALAQSAAGLDQHSAEFDAMRAQIEAFAQEQKQLMNGSTIKDSVKAELRQQAELAASLASLASDSVGQELRGAIERLVQQSARGPLSPEREQSYYERGTNEIDNGRWERAAETFKQVADIKGRKADGALYWRAYSLNKLGQRDNALGTVQTLVNNYPQSRWLNDAKALQMEIQQSSGQGVSAAAATDDDLKLLAINAIMQTDPEQAIPVLEKLLKSNPSPNVKQRALFVLATSKSPKARAVVAEVAKSGSNPDLQLKAVTYLGTYGKDNGAELQAIYQSSSDTDLKRAALRSLMLNRDKDRVFAVAKSEQNAELRQYAMRQLEGMNAQAELAQLYSTEPTVEGKEQIIRSMYSSGNSEKLLEIARTEKDARLRKAAVRNLGLVDSRINGRRVFGIGPGVGAGTGTGIGRRSSGTGATATAGTAEAPTGASTAVSDALVSLYASEQDPEVKKEIIRSLFLRQDGKSLINLARKETNPDMKKELVRNLSLIKSKETTDYMLELLNK